MSDPDMAQHRRDVVTSLMDFCHNAIRTKMWCRKHQSQGVESFSTFCRSMLNAIIEGYLSQGAFEPGVARLGPTLLDSTLELHTSMTNTFLPSAVKFQCHFSLRELSALAQVTLCDVGISSCVT